jgi:hypothetical protein
MLPPSRLRYVHSTIFHQSQRHPVTQQQERSPKHFGPPSPTRPDALSSTVPLDRSYNAIGP